MQSLNKNRIAYLSSLALLFSYIELMIPRFIPFLRLGLSNIALLLALDLNFAPYMILASIKSLVNCFVSGTLLSPFMLISLSQSIASAILMWALFRIRGKLLGLHGISILGATLSQVIQILLASLYLGKETLKLLGPMLLFSAFSGLLTSVLASFLCIESDTPELIIEGEEQNVNRFQNIFFCICIIISSAFIFCMKNTLLLFGTLIVSFALQKISGRKIRLLPHISMWAFILLSSIFIERGRILFSLGRINITEDSLLDSLQKCFKLSSAMALSQCAANLSLRKDGIFSLTLLYADGLRKFFSSQKGKILSRVKSTMQAQTLYANSSAYKKNSFAFAIAMLVLFTLFFTTSSFLNFDLKDLFTWKT